MDRYTLDTTMRAVFADPLLAPLQKYLIYTSVGEPGERISDKSIRESANGWAAEGVLRGLNFLARQMELGRVKQHFIYGGEDCEDDALKRDVNLIQLTPEDGASDTARPYIILCGGGAYKWVSTIIESLPTAVPMVERGYTVFLLTYRVRCDKAAPKALSDLAAAVRYVNEHKEALGVKTERCAIGGFSAGANLICNFGVPALGYKKYGLPKPAALFPVYAFIDLKAEGKHNCVPDLLKPMFGEEINKYIDEYNVVDRIDADYPPCYIVCGRDDMSVPPYNSEKLAELLLKAGVPAILEEGDHAPHAFGEGSGTDVAGWPDRAIDFLERV